MPESHLNGEMKQKLVGGVVLRSSLFQTVLVFRMIRFTIIIMTIMMMKIMMMAMAMALLRAVFTLLMMLLTMVVMVLLNEATLLIFTSHLKSKFVRVSSNNSRWGEGAGGVFF